MSKPQSTVTCVLDERAHSLDGTHECIHPAQAASCMACVGSGFPPCDPETGDPCEECSGTGAA